MTLSAAPDGHEDDAPAPEPPEGLAEAGAALWREIAGAYDLRPDERRHLLDAAREADLIARLDEELKSADSLTVKGSMGQQVAHPMIGELRAHRNTLASLLKALNLGAAEADDAERTASEAGRRAARARWGSRGA